MMQDFSCPIPKSQYSHILLAHGGGGSLMQRLIENVFLPAFGNPILEQKHDAAVIQLSGNRIAFTTDSYVVQPLFFPGGDIGTLAVNGTVNDLAMSGARPLYLSAGFILEEGLPMETLQKVAFSMRQAADAAGVHIVTGDTKVVNQGKGDGIFINTAGIGLIEHSLTIHPQQIQPGDLILINGDIGRHGITIMAMREGIQFETCMESDCAPVADLVLRLIAAGIEIHCLRDLTRGGLAGALHELAEVAGVTMSLDERSIPVLPEVQGACELLGFDPLYIANEGRFAAMIPAAQADQARRIFSSHPLGVGASVIGEVKSRTTAPVLLKSQIGITRIVDRLSGEQLPRIC